MNIVQISAYYPPRLGGMQNVMREISERLAVRGHYVDVFASRIGINRNAVPERQNVNTHYLRGFDVAHTAVIPMLLFALMRVNKDSVMHVHTPRPFVAEVVATAAKLRRIPYIVHVHSDIQPLGFFSFLIKPYKKFVWAWVLRGADNVIFLSDHQESDMRQRLGLTRTSVIPNGVDEKYFVRRGERKLDTVNLLFVGRLNNQKDIPFLLSTMKLLDEPFTLSIVGEGEMRSEIEKLIETNNLSNRVSLVGEKRGQPLIDQYIKADIYVMASHFEGQSLSMLEAMAAGLPVVAIDAPGVTEHLNQGGLTVNDRDIVQFAAAIESLLSNTKKLTNIGKDAQKYASRLSWDNTISQLENVYFAAGEPKP